jgi:hypothetical protein
MIIKPQTFYYHFKREPEKGVNHGAYYVLGLGMNTEQRDSHYVILKPLYYCEPGHEDEKGISFQVRPVEFFDSHIDRGYYKGPRFNLIEDTKVIQELISHPLFKDNYIDDRLPN